MGQHFKYLFHLFFRTELHLVLLQPLVPKRMTNVAIFIQDTAFQIVLDRA